MKILDIFDKLNKTSDNDIIFLKYDNCFQLLIGVILSAQSTDKQVNTVLPHLFKEYPSPKALSLAKKSSVAKIIYSTGFYNIKAENIIQTAKMINQKYKDKVPSNIEDLLTLKGVGRKSANVILGACYNLPAIIVDTHFKRVVFRLGLTDAKDPIVIEKEIKSLVPSKKQYRFSMLINNHGRIFCKARNPLCHKCPLSNLCRFYILTYKNLP